MCLINQVLLPVTAANLIFFLFVVVIRTTVDLDVET